MEPSSSHILATVLAAFEEGALVCDVAGTILAHNAAAVRLLASDLEANETALVGKPAQTWLDGHLLRYAMTEVARPRAALSVPYEPSLFVTGTPQGGLVRVKVVPVEPDKGPVRNVVIVCAPIAPWDTEGNLEGQFLHAFIEGQRGPLASIRAAIETMVGYPDMDEVVAGQFKTIILEQAEALSEHLDASLAEYARGFKAAWPLETMSGQTFLHTLKYHLEGQLGVRVAIDPPDPPMRLRIDSYALTHALGFVAQLVKNATHSECFTCRLGRSEAFAVLDLVWEGLPLRLSRLKNWETQPIELGDTVVTTTLREILSRHRAEMWSGSGENRAYVRVLFNIA